MTGKGTKAPRRQWGRRTRGLLAIGLGFVVAISTAQAAQAVNVQPHDVVLQRAGVEPAVGAAPVARGSEVTLAGERVIIVGAGQSKTMGERQVWEAETVTHVAQRTVDGGQLLSVWEKGRDEERVSYVFADRDLRLLPDGSVAVVDPKLGEVVSQIAAPWAKDGAGRAVPTRYEAQGATLTQVIEPGQGTVFPIIADPSIVNCGVLTPCLKFNRSETLRIYDSTVIGVGATTATLCGLIPWSPPYLAALKAACAGYVAATFANIRQDAATARNTGRCLAVRFTTTGIPLGSRVLTC